MAASQGLGVWMSEFSIVHLMEKYTENAVQLPVCLMYRCEVLGSKMSFLLAVCYSGEIHVWLLFTLWCGEIKLELWQETTSGVGYSFARGMTRRCNKVLVISQLKNVSISKTVELGCIWGKLCKGTSQRHRKALIATWDSLGGWAGGIIFGGLLVVRRKSLMTHWLKPLGQ